MGTKRCPRCETAKSLDDFYRNKGMRDGRHSYCKSCTASYDRERYPNGKPAQRERYFRKTYGLTLDELNGLADSQGGLCAICGTKPERPVVDHCHESGKVRGILCDTCNRCLGLLKDDPTVLMSAAAYLIQHEDVLAAIGGESNR